MINNRIRADKVRLIDENGNQIGIVSIEEALQKARECNLDLIQVTERVDPPVCKVMDYGKYLYRLQKKEKDAKKSVKIKGIRLRFNISPHDLETRVNQAEKFLKKGSRVRVEMVLRGREKRLSEVANEKTKEFITKLSGKTQIKIEGKMKRKANGFLLMISPTKAE